MSTEKPAAEPAKGNPKVTVVRILTEWSFADDAPVQIDEIDRLVTSAALRVRSRG